MNSLCSTAVFLSLLPIAWGMPEWLAWPDWLTWPEWGTVTSGLLYITAVLCFMVGILGCVLPYPGHAFIVVGLVLWAWGNGAPWPSWWMWALQVVLAAFGSFTDSIFALLGAKRFGCSRAAFWCSALGMIVGMFFLPLGLFLGPFLGAFAGELIVARRSLGDSTRSGAGALIGAFVGMGAKFVVAGVMLVIFFL